jgi:DNA-directed RNA polymerase specialized sigma24 family protein
MTTNPTPISPEIWNLAQAILTQKQLTVLTLREKHGFSWNQLAVNLNCTRANVREIHRAATKNLLDELERQRTETQVTFDVSPERTSVAWSFGMNEEKVEIDVQRVERPNCDNHET